MMITTTFDKVSIRGKVSGRCKCGKRRVRRKEFWQSLNPFNKGASGYPKRYDQIMTELIEERGVWEREPIKTGATDMRKQIMKALKEKSHE